MKNSIVKTSNEPKEAEIVAGSVTSGSIRYADNFWLRALIQAVPVWGGALDTLTSGLGQRYQQQRIERLLADISKRLETVSEEFRTYLAEPSEELYDFFSDLMRKVARTRSESKRDYFANLCVKQLSNVSDWDEAAEAMRLLDDLTTVHISILIAATKVPPSLPPYDGHRAFNWHAAIPDERPIANPGTFSLRDQFPHMTEDLLTFYSAELVARGLMRDEGIGRVDVRGMTVFEATPVAFWLIAWFAGDQKE